MRIFLVILLFIITNPALARIGSIPNAVVNEDAWRLNWRSSYNLDDNDALNQRLRSRVGVDYGVTDDYAVMLMLQGQDLQSQSPDFTHFIIDQRFEGATSQDDGYYSGLRLRYEARVLENQSDTAHLRLILGKEVGKWDFRFNQILGMEIGEHRESGMIVDSRWQIAYRYQQNHSIGLESFNQFGNISKVRDFDAQSHSLGATFFGALTDKINYEAGYLVGVSKAAPDHSFYFGFMRDF